MTDTFGQNMFGDVFCSVASTIVQMAGGTMQIIRPGNREERQYDNENHEWIEPESQVQNIAFQPETLKGGSLTHVGTIRIAAGDLVGVVAGADVGEELRPQTDRLVWSGKMYILKSVELIQAGEATALIRLLGGVTDGE